MLDIQSRINEILDELDEMVENYKKYQLFSPAQNMRWVYLKTLYAELSKEYYAK
jgi:Ni/Co efflux regulator RcnB